MAYLTNDEINKLVSVAVDENFDRIRELLFPEGEMTSVRAGLAVFPLPQAQMLSDIRKLNDITRLESGTVPLEVWLENARVFVKNADRLALIDQALQKVNQMATGAPSVYIDDQAVEFKEKIIHNDDMVSFSFLELGDKVGRSVGRLKVWPYENGAPVMISGAHSPHLGTGWLLTDDLVMTNHHVINARQKSNAIGQTPAAPEADLQNQAQQAILEFDYVNDAVLPTEVKFSCLEAWDSGLDFALLRLQNASARAPVVLNQTEIEVESIENSFPVNIIQHPLGEAKKVGLRNNLVYQTNDTEIHYFTDTRQGSSGSPVLDDAWQAIALHKASRPVRDVKFQGKDTAFLNVGTKITKIITQLKANYPEIAGEILK